MHYHRGVIGDGKANTLANRSKALRTMSMGNTKPFSALKTRLKRHIDCSGIMTKLGNYENTLRRSKYYNVRLKHIGLVENDENIR